MHSAAPAQDQQNKPKISKKELLSFQQQARQVEAEKAAKRRKRERKKQEKERKRKREQQAKLVGPVLLGVTVVLSAIIYGLSTLL